MTIYNLSSTSFPDCGQCCSNLTIIPDPNPGCNLAIANGISRYWEFSLSSSTGGPFACDGLLPYTAMCSDYSGVYNIDLLATRPILRYSNGVPLGVQYPYGCCLFNSPPCFCGEFIGFSEYNILVDYSHIFLSFTAWSLCVKVAKNIITASLISPVQAYYSSYITLSYSCPNFDPLGPNIFTGGFGFSFNFPGACCLATPITLEPIEAP